MNEKKEPQELQEQELGEVGGGSSAVLDISPEMYHWVGGGSGIAILI